MDGIPAHVETVGFKVVAEEGRRRQINRKIGKTFL